MAMTKELADSITSLLNLLEDIDPSCADTLLLDLTRFCLFVISLDGKVTAKETQLLTEVLRIKIKQDTLIDLAKKIDWEDYCTTVPESLDLLLKFDTDKKTKLEDSLSLSLLTIYAGLGKVLSEVDASSKKNAKSVEKFILSLGNYVSSSWGTESKKKAKKKRNKAKEITNKTDKESDKSAKSSKSPLLVKSSIQEQKSKVEKLSSGQQKNIPPKTKKNTNDDPSHSNNTDTAKKIKSNEKNSTPMPKSIKVKVPLSGGTSKLDFWLALKPFLADLRHNEFDYVIIKDSDCLDAKPTVIVGVYNSITMRVSLKLLRLELYIDTETETGNLQIIDHIKGKIKVNKDLKGRIEFNRKEGRRAQRVFLNLDGFELQDRSCWANCIDMLLSTADDFFDAVETPMKELV